jgi:hypothetical protein
MATTRGRLVTQNQTVYDQVDFFQSDGFTRVTGLTWQTVQLNAFFENVAQPWLLANGIGVSDAQVASGYVYFNEVPGSPGFYNVRWRPNAIGYWRLLITYAPGQQTEAQDYDVIQSAPTVESGLSASFIKPDCE